MMNTYSSNRQMQKWAQKELFFHLLDLSIIEQFIVLTSSSSKLSHRCFRLAVVRNIIYEGQNKPQPQITHGEGKHLASSPSLTQNTANICWNEDKCGVVYVLPKKINSTI
jgi:hypothetical protein